ncbi:MAG: glycosyltransferase family 4 protein [Candidatus Berkelbacteria bacterium]|nr:glycosyltransferase family 4 protein [Candidatus Berkelbacteria bacterium]
MKKIALISGDGSVAGAPTHVLQVAIALKNNGFDVLVVCPHGPLLKICKDNGIKTEEAPMGGPFDRRALQKINQIIAKYNPDIAHFHGIRAGWLGLIATRHLKKIKKIYTEHLWTKYYHLPNPAYEQFQLRGLKFVDRYTVADIAVSKAVSDFLISRGFDKNKITVIPNGISAEFLELNPIKKPKGTPLIIGSVGSLNRVKNYENMIKAFDFILKKCPDLNIHYQIIGDGPLKDKLESLIKKLNLEEKVHILGKIENVGERMQHFSIFVNASLSESFGLAVGEAMAVGLPIIASNIDSLKDLVQGAGLFINPRNPYDISEKIIELLNDENKREKMGKIGKERTKNHFSEENMISKTLALYKKVL